MMSKEVEENILKIKRLGLTIVGVIHMENGCCNDKPVVVTRVNRSAPPLYACECACGGWCTGCCEHIDEAVNIYRRMCIGEPVYGPHWQLDKGKGYRLAPADETFCPCPFCGKRGQEVWWNRDWEEPYPPTTLQYLVGCDCGIRLDGTVKTKPGEDGNVSVEQAFVAARHSWNKRWKRNGK